MISKKEIELLQLAYKNSLIETKALSFNKNSTPPL